MRQVCAIVLLIACVISASAQSKSAKKTRRRAAHRVVAHANSASPLESGLTAPFNTSVTQLAPHFTGHDIEAVFEAIKAIGGGEKKSEYETTAQFERRKADLARKILFGSLTPTSTFAFVTGNSIANAGVPEIGFTSTYDADSQLLTVKLPASKERLYSEPGTPELLEVKLSGRLISHDRYIASNAFGASVEVSRSLYKEFGVTVDPGTWPFDITTDEYEPTASFVLHVPPDEARQLNSRLRLVLIGTLKNPWIHTSVSGNEPTINLPYDVTISSSFLDFVPQQIWAVDNATGNILKRFSPAEKRMVLRLVSSGPTVIRYSIDGGSEESDLVDGTKLLKAAHKITVGVMSEGDMNNLTFEINGQNVQPNWSVKKIGVGSYSVFESATTMFQQ